MKCLHSFGRNIFVEPRCNVKYDPMLCFQKVVSFSLNMLLTKLQVNCQQTPEFLLYEHKCSHKYIYIFLTETNTELHQGPSEHK